MKDEKPSLEWGKFLGQLLICLIAFYGGIHASLHSFAAQSAAINPDLGSFEYIIGGLLTLGTFLIALRIIRVPYRTDIFERRLRNWSMTYSAVMVFTVSVTINIIYQNYAIGRFLITPFMMPGLWLVCYLVHSQFTRYCIVHDRKNSFIDGNSC